MAYGQILPLQILQLPRWGGVNVHTSLLPRYRGAAPIQWALLDGQSETGVTIMKMDAGLDTGDILAAEKIPITPEDDFVSLEGKLGRAGAELLIRTIPGYLSGRILPQPQPATGITYARKVTKEDGRLRWEDTATALHNRVRALLPWPGAFCYYPVDNRKSRLKIWKTGVLTLAGLPGQILSADNDGIVAACGEGALKITRLQQEGGKAMPAAEFLAGHPLGPGSRLE